MITKKISENSSKFMDKRVFRNCPMVFLEVPILGTLWNMRDDRDKYWRTSFPQRMCFRMGNNKTEMSLWEKSS
jgi:hypothetical protein